MGNTAVAADGETLKPARSDSLLSLLWPAVEAAFIRQLEDSHRRAAVADSSVWATPVLRRFSSPWTLPDVELLVGEMPLNEVESSDNEVEFYWVGSDARMAGTLVHRWLQLFADGRVTGPSLENGCRRDITSRWLHEAGISNEAALPIVARVEDAVTSMLDDDKGRWILSGEGYTELALTGVFEGELMSVIIDRVRIDADGTHWIIDYKTSSHEGGNLAGFLQVETARYAPQLARYSSIYSNWSGQSVKCALYFPLLKSFVEVAV
jgi:hypothetical protein